MAVRTPDPGNTRAGVGAIEIALDHLLDDWPEKTGLLLKASLIISQEPLEMIEHHPVEDRTLRMARAIDSRHIGKEDSRNAPR